jgi:mRNA interferase MazF
MDRQYYDFKKRVRQGDLVVVWFNYSDLEFIEKRLAIIISNNNFNISNQNIVLVPLTSIIKKEDSSLIINSDDFSSGSLKNTSVVRIDEVAGLNKKTVERIVGRVKDSMLDVILNKTRKIFEKSI